VGRLLPTREHDLINGLGERVVPPSEIAMLLDPDGDFGDADRARRRGLTIGRQDGDGMSPDPGLVDPGMSGRAGCGVVQMGRARGCVTRRRIGGDGL
jgi:hypothetical protein